MGGSNVNPPVNRSTRKELERVIRLVRDLKNNYPRDLVEDVLEKMGPEKHLIRYLLEVID